MACVKVVLKAEKTVVSGDVMAVLWAGLTDAMKAVSKAAMWDVWMAVMLDIGLVGQRRCWSVF